MARDASIEGALQVNFSPPTLLAVTVLTSWTSESFEKELLIKQTLQKRVNHLAGLAVSSGIGGCVCSPLEVATLRTLYPKPFELVTPGIRPSSVNFDDQARVLTPANALKLGASRLVIGRAITKADDPLHAFETICKGCVN